MTKINIHAQIIEVERELGLRRRFDLQGVQRPKMRGSEVDLVSERLEAVLRTLIYVRENEAAFRAFHEGRKAVTAATEPAGEPA